MVVSPSIVELSANITSLTSPVATRSMRLLICRSPGDTPSIGDITPPSTWYTPLNCIVFSTAMTSWMFSTTQIMLWSRRGLAHIGQMSVSDILWHSLQYFASRFSVSIADEKASTSSSFLRNRCSTRRVAVLRPMPGSLENSLTARSKSVDGYSWFILLPS